jgi:hypothetical protein
MTDKFGKRVRSAQLSQQRSRETVLLARELNRPDQHEGWTGSMRIDAAYICILKLFSEEGPVELCSYSFETDLGGQIETDSEAISFMGRCPALPDPARPCMR